MKAKPTKSQSANPRPAAAQGTNSLGFSARFCDTLTLCAFLMVIALVVLRATMSETLRDPELVVPGMQGAPRGVGPAQSVALDLACCVPALLVMTRRLLDRTYHLRAIWSFVPLGLLCAIMAASAAWASDKYMAAVLASHWIAACALFWAVAQLVRSWLRLRFVAAVCVGLLGVLAARGVYYRLIEFPDMVRHFDQIKNEEFKRRGWEPDSFVAQQFTRKVHAGEMIGFNVSANSFAALLVMLGVVAGGVIIQRASEGRGENATNVATGIALTAAVMALASWVLFLTRCKAAIATPVLAIAFFVLLGLWRKHLAAHAGRWFFIGLGIFVAGMAAVVGHGLHHHTLPSISMAFRWDYWVGAGRVAIHHPLLGVGWANFSRYYLQYRLPQASEEVLDPHCFLVRFFVELGVVGGAMMVVWMIRLWWELTRPVLPPERTAATAPASAKRPANKPDELGERAPMPSSLRWMLMAGPGWFVLSLITSIDWSQDGGYVFLEVLERLQYLAVLVVVTAVVAMRSLQPPTDDHRPAPWTLYGMIIAAATLLIHNLIEFSMFETGILLTLMLLLGSVLGIRGGRLHTGQAHTGDTPPHGNTPAVAAAFAASLIGWLIAAGFFFGPLASADASANRADDLLRNKYADQAERLMVDAREIEPLDADYAYRAAAIAIMQDKPAEYVRPLLSIAIDRDPRNPKYPLTMAQMEERHLEENSASLSAPQRQLIIERIRVNYEKALELDPNNVEMRLKFARWLAGVGDHTVAKGQFNEALRLNDALRSDDLKRITGADLEKLQKEAGGL